ncbi:hypothetical protein GX586_03930 [bacterium]|nr:hypothetical protein [bacterium]
MTDRLRPGSTAPSYAHTQRGTVILTALAGGAVVCLAIMLIKDVPGFAPFIVAGIMAVTGVMFSTLTIEIAGDSLRWRFGPGLIRFREPLGGIARAEPTRTSFWCGWGIHLTLRGWLYNVSGFDAVLVTRKNGRTFLLGTDEPEKLSAAINEAAGGRGAFDI